MFYRNRQILRAIPRNPLVADPLFLAGYIEQAGTGTLDMIARCREAGLKLPQFRQDGGSFVQTLWRPGPQATTQVTKQDNLLASVLLPGLAAALGIPTAQATAQAAAQVTKVLTGADAEAGVSREDLQRAADIAHREHFRNAYLEPLVTAGWLERTIPDKPTSPNQRYRLTAKGKSWLRSASPS